MNLRMWSYFSLANFNLKMLHELSSTNIARVEEKIKRENDYVLYNDLDTS